MIDFPILKASRANAIRHVVITTAIGKIGNRTAIEMKPGSGKSTEPFYRYMCRENPPI